MGGWEKPVQHLICMQYKCLVIKKFVKISLGVGVYIYVILREIQIFYFVELLVWEIITRYGNNNPFGLVFLTDYGSEPIDRGLKKSHYE